MIRMIGVTSAKSHPAFPELPSLANVAPGFDAPIWVAVFAPAKTPPAVVARLNEEINVVAASPDLALVLEPDGTLPQAASPAALSTRFKDELVRWKKIASEHHIVAE
jgi:tripartite-type tricarboxylate transporter receptor subunit TctC